MKTVSFNSSSGSVDIQVAGEESVTLMQPIIIYTDETTVSFKIDGITYAFGITDSITINGVTFSGTLTQLRDALAAVFPISSVSPNYVMTETLAITTTADSFTIISDGYEVGTWNKINQSG